MLALCLPAALASGNSSQSVEATTSISLPVDSVTIYPDGLMSVKRMGTLDVTEGQHKFVLDVPDAADKDTVLLSVTNATVERIVYQGNPVYTLNVSKTGMQKFVESYLMYNAGSWEPRYDLQLSNDSLKIAANAVVQNNGGQDLLNIKLKLVAGLPSQVQPYLAKGVATDRSFAGVAEAAMLAPAAAPSPYISGAGSTGQLETLYIFELEGRKDLEMGKKIGLPLFEKTAPIVRTYTWDAYNDLNGPAVEEIRANNTMKLPWPAGNALLYRDGEFVSSISMPYTANGTNASIEVGSAPGLKVSKSLKDYNISEKIKAVKSVDNQNHTVKETTENWTYQLKIDSSLDMKANLEVTDSRPKEAKILAISPKPFEVTATGLKWKLLMEPQQKIAINYTYQVVNTERMDASS
ncbi:Uncharacterised protein [uncultured archaeon]|nr:Uncharacterised protein [uncultured archaeon]